MDWDTVLLPCIAHYSPPSPDSFQDVANQISQDYANGEMVDWKYYNFPYNAPPVPPDGLEDYVGSAVVSLTSQTVYDACLTTGTLFFVDFRDDVNKRGRLWFVILTESVTWPPPEYPV